MPFTHDRVAASKRTRGQSAVIKTPTILCVDDDPDIHTSLELRMRDYHIVIERAFHGMQGITETVDTHPDLILMDLAMPNGDGQYVLDWVKNNYGTQQIPVIILTGMRDPQLKRQLLHAGAADFLLKPILFDDLLHSLSRFVDIRERKSTGENE